MTQGDITPHARFKVQPIIRKGLSLLALCWLASSTYAVELSQQQLNDLGEKARVRYGVISNFGQKPVAHIYIDNQSSTELPTGSSQWRIYIHSTYTMKLLKPEGLTLKHVQGDLHELAPTQSFAGLAAGKHLDIIYEAGGSLVHYSDFLPRAFISREGLTPVVFANTNTESLNQFIDPFVKPEQQLRFNSPKPDLYSVTTAATRYEKNREEANKTTGEAISSKNHAKIIPTPKEVRYSNKFTTIDNQWQIFFAPSLESEANYLVDAFKQASITLNASTKKPKKSPVIKLAIDASLSSPESYKLIIGEKAISLVGSDSAGIFYGIQSLLNLFPTAATTSITLPQLTAVDSPRFSWRGMHYDMARNFHSKAATLRLIEQMARYKLNLLHLHLSDDEGWRLEIPGLPELTEIGAHRCFDLSEQHCLLTQLGTGPSTSGSGNGYYTTKDFIEILQFAHQRHIQVIPEIDMPGHARAAIKSMEARYYRLRAAGKLADAEAFLLSDLNDKSVYSSVQNYTDNAVNVCLPSTYTFVEKIIRELQSLYAQAGVPLTTYHMGGDEVGSGAWTASPACKTFLADNTHNVKTIKDLKPYFIKQLSDITSAHQLALAGWEDGLMQDPNTTFQRQSFNNKRIYAHTWDNLWERGAPDRAYRLANADYDVILSPATHLYFDHPQAIEANARGHYWATRYVDTERVFSFMPNHFYANADKTATGEPIQNLAALIGRALTPLQKPEHMIGMQGQIWSETIRTEKQLEQMLYPRLIALAERAWHKAEWEADQPNSTQRNSDWQQFLQLLNEKELPALAKRGVDFYIPPPGAVVNNNKILANTATPNAIIEVSDDQGTSWKTLNASEEFNNKPWLLRSKLNGVVSDVTELRP